MEGGTIDMRSNRETTRQQGDKRKGGVRNNSDEVERHSVIVVCEIGGKSSCEVRRREMI
jgi:hypothetical protein